MAQICDQWVLFQNGMDTLPEHSVAFAMDDPDFAKAFFMSRLEVIIQEFVDLARLEGVQIESVLDGQDHRLPWVIVQHWSILQPIG